LNGGNSETPASPKSTSAAPTTFALGLGDLGGKYDYRHCGK
jgi:hypothetical protein